MPAWMTYPTVVAVLCIALAFSLPLFILAYYYLRLKLRRNSLKAKIMELHLEPEYLRAYHFNDWQAIHKTKSKDEIRKRFEIDFDKLFHGENSFKNYLLPLALSGISTVVVAFFIYDTVVQQTTQTFIDDRVLFYAFAGALLYVFPLYVVRYASFSLNPPILFELVWRLWLSTIVGIVIAQVVAASLQSAAAFLGALLPLAAIDFLRKKVFEKPEEEEKRVSEMLSILHDDRNLLSQLEYLGIRSVLEMAYENPLKIFVGTDLNLVACIDLVDQANLRLYVPDPQTRVALNSAGIRTAIDIMTQLYEELPTQVNGHEELTTRFLKPDEPLPAHLVAPMENLSTLLKFPTVEALRNMMQMMIDNPQLTYVLDLWNMLDDEVDKSMVEE